MNFIVKILLYAVAVILSSYLLEPWVYVDSFLDAVIIAVVLSLLNVTLKPLLILFTIPATVMTLGLFLFVINAIIIMVAGAIVPGFEVDGFFSALGFSLLLWLVNSLLSGLSKKD